MCKCNNNNRRTSSEVSIIYDLNGFEKSNADNRAMKFLLDVFTVIFLPHLFFSCSFVLLLINFNNIHNNIIEKEHYPGRIGCAYVINCPFFYRLLWKLVKPWLGGSMISKVNMVSSNDSLQQFFTKQNLLPEHGGCFVYNNEKVII